MTRLRRRTILVIYYSPSSPTKRSLPIREALIRLSLESLIIMLPRRGTSVADLNASALHKLYEIRYSKGTGDRGQGTG